MRRSAFITAFVLTGGCIAAEPKVTPPPSVGVVATSAPTCYDSQSCRKECTEQHNAEACTLANCYEAHGRRDNGAIWAAIAGAAGSGVGAGTAIYTGAASGGLSDKEKPGMIAAAASAAVFGGLGIAFTLISKSGASDYDQLQCSKRMAPPP
jgi:hypothetical protein